jgi:hypothetical protein
VLLYPSLGYHGALIEMKAGKNDLTEKQKEFGQALDVLGYFQIKAWSWTEAARKTVSYMCLRTHHPIPER